MARGGSASFRVISAKRPVASSSPSTRTSSGRVRSRNSRRCHAPIGDRWRMPNRGSCQLTEEAAYSFCSEQALNNGRQSAPRFLTTLVRYSCQVVRSLSSSLTIEPCSPAARSSAVTSPEPKLPASAMLLARTEMASAVESRSEEHTSELQSLRHLVCRLLLEKKKKTKITNI